MHPMSRPCPSPCTRAAASPPAIAALQQLLGPVLSYIQPSDNKKLQHANKALATGHYKGCGLAIFWRKPIVEKVISDEYMLAGGMIAVLNTEPSRNSTERKRE